ncbi:uncharacterized protein V1513DRAFT_166652 [Lipomyces chichibuensis]|uniref:uncharacterized protein n=1 Tax=Lipomyces chichibuensis TaxID=1546026 RepID=UPI003342F14D
MAKSARQTGLVSKRVSTKKRAIQENQQLCRVEKENTIADELQTRRDIRAFAFRSRKKDVNATDKAAKKPVLVENGAGSGNAGIEVDGLQSELTKLKTLFVAIDKTLWVFYGGDVIGATITFSQVKRQVESVCRRQCNLGDLQKILYLYPDAYQLTKKLTISDYVIEYVQSEGIKTFQDPDFLPRRERLFDTLCADFETAHSQREVPLHPLPASQKFGNATRTLITQRAESLRKNARDVKLPLRGETVKKPVFTTASVATREQQLLERIRAKQAARDEALKSAVSPAVARRCAALGRIPAIVDVLLQVQASSSGDNAIHMLLRKAVELVRDSIRVSGVPPNADEVAEAVEVLGQIVPQWCHIATVGAVSTMKLTGRQVCGLSREDILAKVSAEREELLQ